MFSLLEWNAHFTYDKKNNLLTKVAAEFNLDTQEELPPLELTIQVWGKITLTHISKRIRVHWVTKEEYIVQFILKIVFNFIS